MAKKLNGEHSSRPYRIWWPKEDKQLPGCNFEDPDHALDGAWRRIHWAPVGTVYEVINKNTGRDLCAYKRGVDGAKIIKGR